MQLTQLGILSSFIKRQARQAAGIQFTSVQDDQLTINWTSGSRAARLVVMKATTSVDTNPSDNTTYTANTTFGSGTQIGTGNYVVYASTGSSVTVTGLTANTLYHVRIYEYNGGAGAETYDTSTASQNPHSVYSFTTEYQAVIDRAVVLTYSLPSDYGQQCGNGLLRALKADGIWATLDVFWVPINDGSSQFGTINWVTPASHQITLINSPTWSALVGYTGNGTNSYVNMNYIPSSAGVNFTLNDAGFGGYCSASGGTFISHLIPSVASRNALSIPAVAGTATLNINGNTVKSGTANGGIGFWHALRTASNVMQLYKDGVQIINSNEASSARPSVTMYAGARNNNGTADLFSTASIGCLWAANNLSTKIQLFAVEWDIYNYQMNNPTPNDTYEPFGEILNDTFVRASIGQNYAIQGSTATWACDGAKLTTTLGTGVLQRLNWLYGNSFEKFTITAVVKLISAPSGTTAGISVGCSDFTNSSVERSVFGQISTLNVGTGGKCIIHSFDGTTDTSEATSAGTLTVTNGDTYTLVFTKSVVAGFIQYDLAVTRLAGGSNSTTWTTTSEAQGNSTGYFALFAHGGSFEISSLVINVQDYKGIQDLWIGDSITHGYDGDDLISRFANQVSDNFARTFEVSAGNGDVTANVLTKLSSIRDYEPARIFLMIGGNDAAGGIAQAVYEANYTAIVNFLRSTGAEVILLKVTPRNAFDMATINTFIDGFPEQKIDTFTSILGTGFALDAAYNSGDGVHPNQTGMDKLATDIIADL